MPRAQQSTEGKVLGFFRTAPLLVIGLVYRLAGDIVKEREAHAAKAGEGARKAIAKKKRQAAASDIGKKKAAPAAPKKKKKHAGGTAPGAQVDDFQDIDGIDGSE